MAIKFTEVPKQTYPEWGMRAGTPCYPLEMNFIFLNGGMGDYIAWAQAVLWLASEATWITGTWVVPDYFLELATHWLKPYPKWRVTTYSAIKGTPEHDGKPFRGPVNLQTESLNATGAHLFTCGWVYFTNKECAPPGWNHYPVLESADLAAVELPEAAAALPAKKYAVITTGVTTNSRKIPGSYWNPIIEHVVSKGLTPVFLGKETVVTGNPKNIKTKFSEDIRYDLGVDLRDQTTLMQAAAVIDKAALVIGHDNGLLHLTGCTATPLVFGYNLASTQHREPPRRSGPTYNVHLTQQDLACNFCQSNMNFMIGYVFRECFYSDNKCIDLLFADDGARWKTKIDLALSEGK